MVNPALVGTVQSFSVVLMDRSVAVRRCFVVEARDGNYWTKIIGGSEAGMRLTLDEAALLPPAPIEAPAAPVRLQKSTGTVVSVLSGAGDYWTVRWLGCELDYRFPSHGAATSFLRALRAGARPAEYFAIAQVIIAR